MPAPANPHRQKLDEVHFLADEFGIPAPRAAELVAEAATEAEDLAAEAMREEHERDPLAGAPVPAGDKDLEHIEKDIGDLEKPVRHDRSAPT